jgi:hypothetical protein
MKIVVHLKNHGRVICIQGYINLFGMGAWNINFPTRKLEKSELDFDKV